MKNWLKSILRFFVISLVMFFVLPAIIVAWATYRQEKVPKGSVLHVVIDGPLAETSRPTLSSLVGGRMHTTLHSLAEGIRHAGDDPRIAGLVLDIRTASLGLAQIGELGDAVSAFGKSHKFNVAYLETAGELGHGDGAYALACSAEKIYLSPPGEIGLSGLRSEVPFVKETLARLHVQAYTEQRYEYKNFANTFTQDKFTPEHLEGLKTVLDDLQETLLGRMAAGRHVQTAEARRLVEGSPYAAQEALAAHLVDGVAYWDEVRAEAQKVAGHDDFLIDAERYAATVQRGMGGTDMALIVVAGQINLGDSGDSPVDARDNVGSNTIARAFRDARKAGVKGVVLRIDSPGGSYVASDLIRREVALTRKEGIPVVVSMGNVAASGGYFIAADADAIVVEPGSITGSIGVFAATFALREALHHWLGASFGVYEALPHPGNLTWLDPPTPADRERIGKTLDRIYRDFVTKVATARHKSYDEVHGLARGRIWSGRQAVNNGLADTLGGMETALAELRKRAHLEPDADLNLVVYPEPDPFSLMAQSVLGGQSRVALPAALQPAARVLTRVLSPLEDTLLLAPL